jgi:hypothetical protein
MSDTVYYSDGSLQVTEREIILPKRTYQLADVKSTSIATAKIGSRELESWQYLFYYSLFLLSRGSSENPDLWRFEPLAGRSLYVGDGYFFLLLILAMRAFLSYRAFFLISARVYLAKVTDSFGEVVILAAIRREQVQKLLDAINAAITRNEWGENRRSDDIGDKPRVIPFSQETLGEIRRMVWVDGSIYDTSNITTVAKSSTASHPRFFLASLIGDVAALCIFVALLWAHFVPKDFFFAGIVTLLLLGSPGLVLSFAMSKSRWPTVYLAKLKTATGTEYLFASIDEERVQEVVDYISISLPYGPKSGYITDSEVQVNDVEARFGKRIFAVGDIKAVDVQVVRSNSQDLQRFGTLALVLASLIIALDFYLAYGPAHWLALLAVPLLILPGVILILMSKKTTYTLTLQGRFGEVQAYSSHSGAYIRKIATALRVALMRKGETMEAQGS